MRRTRIVPRGAFWRLQERRWWGWRTVMWDTCPAWLRQRVYEGNAVAMGTKKGARWWLPPRVSGESGFAR